MPSGKPKRLEDAIPEIRVAYRNAFANPGEVIVVAADAPLSESKRLQVKLAAVRKGFVMFLSPGHEHHKAAIGNCLHICQVWDRQKPFTRTVTLKYDGRMRPPSELVEEYKRQMADGGK